MKYLPLILLMTGALAGASPQPLPAVTDGLQALIDRGEIRAAVVGLYAGGQRQVLGMGQIGRTDERSPDADTVFELGSVSKVFTALLTQVQVNAGKLSWDEPVARYLPQVEFASELVAAITLRELATHTSGLPRLPDNMMTEDALDPYAGYGNDDLMAFLATYQPEQLVKESAYSNLGSGLLGVIAAASAGGSYAEAMQRLVLQPLAMNSSAAGLPEALKLRLAGGFSQGADMPNWDGFDALAGAGAIVSTAADMLRFAALNLHDDPPQPLAGALAAALAAIRQPQTPAETGLAWQIAGNADDPIYWHNGGTGGYASFLAIRPRTGEAVVLLTASTAYSEVTSLGMAQISGEVAPATNQPLAAYVGTFKLGEGFMLRVSQRDGKLYGQATGQAEFPLTADGTHRFTFAPAAMVVTFNEAESGPAAGLTLVQGGRTMQAPRVADHEGPPAFTPIELPAEALTDFAGRFLLAPGAVLSIEARAGQLYAQLTGQAAYPVFPYQTDAFFYRVVDAQLKFERDDQGRVIAVVLHQGGEKRAPRIE